MMQQHRGVVPLKKSSSARYRPLARSANASSGGVGEIKCCHEPNPSSARHGLRAQDVWSPRPQQRLRKKTPGHSAEVQLSHSPALTCLSTVSHVYDAASLPLLLQKLPPGKMCVAPWWRNVVLLSALFPKGYGGFNYCLINFFFSL